MFRRNFITRLAMSGAATIANVGASDSKTVTYRIKGFTSVTCATGLETLLSKRRGVVRAHSSFPAASTEIQFRPSQTNESALKDFISSWDSRQTSLRRWRNSPMLFGFPVTRVGTIQTSRYSVIVEVGFGAAISAALPVFLGHASITRRMSKLFT